MANILKQHEPYTIKILQFFTYLKKFFKLEEIIDAIIVEFNEELLFNFNLRIFDTREIISIYFSLIFFIKIKLNISNNEEWLKLRLTHFSIKEYLVSDRVKENIKRNIIEIYARKTIAQVCLVYMVQIAEIPVAISKMKKDYPFIEYAAKFWMIHANHALIYPKVENKVCEIFFKQRTVYNFSILVFNADILNFSSYRASPLYYASLNGCNAIIRLLLEHDADVNAQGGTYRNALQAASIKGHQNTVQMLL